MSDYGFTSAGTSYEDEDRLTGYARASGTFTQAWNLTPVGDWNSITLLPSNLTPKSSPLYRYVYASYIDEPVVRKVAGTGGTIHYYHRNQQYSITAMTTSTGAVAERYAYTAYGQPTILNASGTVITSSAVGNRYTYTGREWDATLGLHHFRARWMSPLAGRFLGRDPIGYEGSEWSLYELEIFLADLDPNGLSLVYNAPDEQFCEIETVGSQHFAECTIPGIFSNRTVRVPCPSQDYQACCNSEYGQKVLNVEGFVEYEFQETCSYWEIEPLEASVLPIVPILRACRLIARPITRSVRGVTQVLRTIVTRSRHVAKRTGSVAKTVMKRCNDWCKKFASDPLNPEKGGTPSQRNDCTALCRSGAGLTCGALKLLCQSMPSGEKQDMCFEFHRFTCLKPHQRR